MPADHCFRAHYDQGIGPIKQPRKEPQRCARCDIDSSVFTQVAVLFAYAKGLTELAEQLDPKQLHQITS